MVGKKIRESSEESKFGYGFATKKCDRKMDDRKMDDRKMKRGGWMRL